MTMQRATQKHHLPSPPTGFTLVELLVVIAIIGVLVAMTFPAVQASREVGRRHLCRANLAQLAVAMQNYENAFECFPPGVNNPDGPIRSEPKGMHYGWITQLLPQLDEKNLYRAIDFSAGVYDSKNAQARAISRNIWICPTEPHDRPGASSYAGCHNDVEAPIDGDNHGILFLNSRVRRDEITDGLAYTILLGEKRCDYDDLGWMSGTRATLRNTGLPLNDPRYQNANSPPDGPDAKAVAANPLAVGGFASAHVGGAVMAYADGSVRFVADSIDVKLWQQMGHRSDGTLLNVDLREF